MSHDEQIAGYDVLGVLGYGANSTIYAVRDRSDSQLFALKRVIRKDESDQRFIDQMVTEQKVSAQLDHRTIRKCYHLKYKKKAFFTVEEAYLLMELVEGHNLFERRPPTLGELVRIYLIVAEALAAMNDAGLVHADMKPNNIIVDDDGTVKVIDLGQSCPVGTVKQRIQGTPDYIAPEQVRRRPLTAQTDMFNFGATMYWCVTDHHVPTLIPREDEDGKRIRQKLRPANELNKDLPLPLNNLIMDCLRTRPIERPESWKVLRDRLELAAAQINRDQATFDARSHGTRVSRELTAAKKAAAKELNAKLNNKASTNGSEDGPDEHTSHTRVNPVQIEPEFVDEDLGTLLEREAEERDDG